MQLLQYIATASNLITARISLNNDGPLQQAGDILQYWSDQSSSLHNAVVKAQPADG